MLCGTEKKHLYCKLWLAGLISLRGGQYCPLDISTMPLSYIQGFCLRPEARHIVRSFLIPRQVLWYQYSLEILSELQPCLRNAGNSVSECLVLKFPGGEGMPPDLPRCLRLALPRQISCPVLSQPCLLLYKTIENPVYIVDSVILDVVSDVC